mmetsp:Transcript_37980/g.121896  ORF Transcript_37980/g.121896 Transcript_37980/m.121896 type:complete len:375 (-) Transcript_37980:1794-2918(-)
MQKRGTTTAEEVLSRPEKKSRSEEEPTPARRWFLANAAVEQNPGQAGGFVVRAVAFLSMARPWEAVADLDRALRFAGRGMGGSADEEARIRLLRGHAHSACLSYDRAAADFATAYDILHSLEEDDSMPRTAERATPAHAKAGLAVVYGHMRRWSDCIRTGETAVQQLKFDDVARLHASRAVETARQHLAAERRGGRTTTGSAGSAERELHMHHSSQASSGTTTTLTSSSKLAVQGQGSGLQLGPGGSHHNNPPSHDASTHFGFSSSNVKKPLYHSYRGAQQSSSSQASPPASTRMLHADETGFTRDLSAMSIQSLPKNLSIASLAMSLSMASINSENWELAGGDRIPDEVLDVLDSSGTFLFFFALPPRSSRKK